MLLSTYRIGLPALIFLEMPSQTPPEGYFTNPYQCFSSTKVRIKITLHIARWRLSSLILPLPILVPHVNVDPAVTPVSDEDVLFFWLKITTLMRVPNAISSCRFPHLAHPPTWLCNFSSAQPSSHIDHARFSPCFCCFPQVAVSLNLIWLPLQLSILQFRQHLLSQFLHFIFTT